MRALNYFLEEALASLWRGRRSSLLSIVTIATALFVLGGFLIVTSNLERLLARWSSAAELSVYLRDDISPADQASIERALDGSGLVAAREYVSKADALQRFQRDFPDLASAAAGLEDNPFPASVDVRLQPDPAQAAAVDRLARELQRAGGVADVRYDRRWIERLLTAVGVVRGAGLALAGILALAAALTVANVVRLALYARRDEIHIMQLVGAPLAYIRGPFVLEGVIQGTAGAVLALLVLWIGFEIADARYGRLVAGALDLAGVGFLPLRLSAGLVAGGMAVGCAGGLVAARGTRSSPDR